MDILSRELADPALEQPTKHLLRVAMLPVQSELNV